MTIAIALAGALLSACSGSSASPPLANESDAEVIDADRDRTPDAASFPDAGAPACAVVLLSRSGIFEAGEGGHATIAAETNPPGGSIAPALPDGWNWIAPAGSDTAITIKVAYGAEGTYTATLAADCGNGASASRTFQVAVRKLSWSPIRSWTAANGPDAREHPAVWIDAGDPNRLLLYGGFLYDPVPYAVAKDLWTLDLAGETWVKLSQAGEPLARAGGAFALVPATRSLLMFGGDRGGDDAETSYSMAALDYEPGHEHWTAQAVTTGTAAGVTLHAFLYDEPRDRFVAFGGFTQGTVSNQLRVYTRTSSTGGAWSDLTATGDGPPAPRYGFFWVHDRPARRLVIFSGAQYPTSRDPVNAAQDTWALELAEDPPRWVRLPDPPIRVGGRNGCFAFDPEGRRMFVWGGTADQRTTVPGLHALDLDRGFESWTEVQVEHEPPERSSGIAVYDGVRRRILMGFGNTTRAVYADFWALNL
jgi:hypothetical protein